MKREVLIRGVDDAVYRRAKARATIEGKTMGFAATEALRAWVEAREQTRGEAERGERFYGEYLDNLEFAVSNWHRLAAHRGKTVVISDHKLQGMFGSYAEACVFSSKFRVALVFVVDERPTKKEVELELGPDLVVQ